MTQQQQVIFIERFFCVNNGLRHPDINCIKFELCFYEDLKERFFRVKCIQRNRVSKTKKQKAIVKRKTRW